MNKDKGAVTQDKFKGTILRDIGSLPISNTQRIRILLIEDEGAVKASLQKWWRPNKDSDWQAGKGFTFDKPEECQELSRLMGIAAEQMKSLEK